MNCCFKKASDHGIKLTLCNADPSPNKLKLALHYIDRCQSLTVCVTSILLSHNIFLRTIEPWQPNRQSLLVNCLEAKESYGYSQQQRITICIFTHIHIDTNWHRQTCTINHRVKHKQDYVQYVTSLQIKQTTSHATRKTNKPFVQLCMYVCLWRWKSIKQGKSPLVGWFTNSYLKQYISLTWPASGELFLIFAKSLNFRMSVYVKP